MSYSKTRMKVKIQSDRRKFPERNLRLQLNLEVALKVP